MPGDELQILLNPSFSSQSERSQNAIRTFQGWERNIWATVNYGMGENNQFHGRGNLTGKEEEILSETYRRK